MADVFISYARSTAKQALAATAALRGLGYSVWVDEDLPSHRPYADVIKEQLAAAKAVVVIWSNEAVNSQWVRSEANRARGEGKLVQLKVDGAILPMPFDQIQCVDLRGWTGKTDAPGWGKVIASVGELVGGEPIAGLTPSLPEAALRLPPWSRSKWTWGAAIACLAAIAVVVGLGVIARPPPALSMRSVAVLPIRNLTGDPSLDAAADRLTEDAMNIIGRGKLIVAPRDPTFALAGKPLDLRLVRETLHVRYAVSASLRRAEPGYRVSFQVADTTTGQTVGSGDFGAAATPDGSFPEARLAGVMLEQVAQQVIYPRWSDGVLSRGPNEHDPEYVAARILKIGESMRREDIPEALRLIKVAPATLAGDKKLAWEFDAAACYYLGNLIASGFDTSAAQRTAWASAALELGRRAAELNPNTTSPHECRAYAFATLERWDEADAEAAHIFETVPLSHNGFNARAELEFDQGQFREALADFNEFAVRVGGDPLEIGMTHLFMNNTAAALPELRGAAVNDPKEPLAPFWLAAALELSGRHSEALTQASVYRKLKTDDGGWRRLELSHEPAYLEAAGRVHRALHAAGLDEASTSGA
jgi:adenylate cyclase